MITLEESLLNEYLKFDYLNKNLNSPQIKIFVSYIKPSFLFKTNILTPIHLGRAVEKDISKDGLISDLEIDWLHKNCISDDDFIENISSLNRRVGFLTGTYYAYKNYNKLNNPQYFGSFGYRRLFCPFFLNVLNEYDAIIPEPEYTNEKNLISQFEKFHGLKLFKIMQSTIKELHSQDFDLFMDYMHNSFGYFREIYVFKKNIFFDFCNWIFPMLFHLLKLDISFFDINDDEMKSLLLRRNETKEQFLLYKLREVGFIIERLTGFYLYKLTLNKKYRTFPASLVCFDDKKEKSFFDLQKKDKMDFIKNKISNIKINNSGHLTPVNIVSVVNDFNLYKKYFLNNPFLKNKMITHFSFDNTKEQIAIPERYNAFLNNYNYSNESWFVFCRQDFEIIDDVVQKLNLLYKDNIYGPIGAKIKELKSGIFPETKGFLYIESDNNFYMVSDITSEKLTDLNVDTIDDTALVVHSSLINKYNLRFDTNLKCDLYSEDFCINANKNYGVDSFVFCLKSISHLNMDFIKFPISYKYSLDYLKYKYDNELYASINSIIGGKFHLKAKSKDILIYNIRKNLKNYDSKKIIK